MANSCKWQQCCNRFTTFQPSGRTLTLLLLAVLISHKYCILAEDTTATPLDNTDEHTTLENIVLSTTVLMEKDVNRTHHIIDFESDETETVVNFDDNDELAKVAVNENRALLPNIELNERDSIPPNNLGEEGVQPLSRDTHLANATISEVANDSKLEIHRNASHSISSTEVEKAVDHRAVEEGNQEESNEIFTILENNHDEVNEIEVSPNFVNSNSEESSTQNLEESIRNSVKTEIELEQNLGSSPILNVLKDISEPDIRQRLTEDILSIDQPPAEQVPERLIQKVESASAVPNTIDRTAAIDVELPVEFESNRKIVEHAEVARTESVREARNSGFSLHEDQLLHNGQREKLEEHNVFHNTKEAEEEHVPLTSFEYDSSESLNNEIHTENQLNSIEFSANAYGSHSPISESCPEMDEGSPDATTTPASDIASFDVIDEMTTPPSADDVLSIELDESLTATEPSSDDLQKLIRLEKEEVSKHGTAETETTVAPEGNKHMIIKKQGVQLDEELEFMLTSHETTTAMIEQTQTQNQNPNQRLVEEEGGKLAEKPRNGIESFQVGDSNEVHNETAQDDDIAATTSFGETAVTTGTLEPKLDAETKLVAVDSNIVEDISVVQINEENTQKGSRSVNTAILPRRSDDGAATLFEGYPPRDAGQTFNDNLAAEATNGIGKALPVIVNDGSNRSTIIIILSSGTALLFIVVSVTIFLISFHRQHGTLDIEMQERNCGKDNLDEEDAETFAKLLQIELPPPVAVALEETDECL